MDQTHAQSIPSGAVDPSTTRLFLTVFPSIMLPMFLAVADQTIVASALPAIAATTGDVERISWVVVAYLLAATIAAPVYGYLGDSFGRRRLMFAALALFIVASVLCALAPTITLLSAARVLQGLGGGGLMSLSQALVGEVVPPRQRGHFQGYLAANATASSAFGPVAGGYLTQHFGWRSIFLINVPLGLAAIVLAFRLASRAGTRSRSWTFDFGGLALFVAAVCPVLLALQILERPGAAQLIAACGLLALATSAAAALILYERRRTQPLIPLALLRQRLVWMANALVVCHGAALTALVAFFPLFLRVIHGASAAESGLLLLPITAGIGLGSIITGRIVTRTGRTMIFPAIGLSAATAVLFLFAWRATALTFGQMALQLSIAATAMGTVMSVAQVAVQNAAGPTRLGAAAASIQLSRSVGSALGTALFGTVLFAGLLWTDPHAGPLLAKVVDLGPQALDAASATARASFVEDLSGAFRAGFVMIAGFTAAGATLAWLNPGRKISS